jgi:hypothetical protein
LIVDLVVEMAAGKHGVLVHELLVLKRKSDKVERLSCGKIRCDGSNKQCA